MKAMLIDAVNKKCKVVEYSGKLEQMRELIGCDIVTVGARFHQHVMFVDDEGLINGTNYYWKTVNAPQWYAGNALILHETEGKDIRYTPAQIKEMEKAIQWMSVDDDSAWRPEPEMYMSTIDEDGNIETIKL